MKRVALGVNADRVTWAAQRYEKAGMRVVRRSDLHEKQLRPGIDLAKKTVE